MSSAVQTKTRPELRHIPALPKQFKPKSLFTGKPLLPLRLQPQAPPGLKGLTVKRTPSPDFLHSRILARRGFFQHRYSTEVAPPSGRPQELSNVPRIRRPDLQVFSRRESVPAKEAMRDKDWTVRARNSISTELSRCINASNGVRLAEEAPGLYKFYLGRGNNSALVKQCLPTLHY